ncbi:protein FAR1-RELATED SEQUENCE 7-like [Capsicum galapagoense]
MRRKYEIIISYNKRWRAVQDAYTVIRGTAEENYNRLPSYLHIMKENSPDMYTNIKRDDENRFQYAFFAYDASIIGWTNYRPVIMVDAIFLKSKYRGILMIAVSKDEKKNIFPLAFGIVDSENNESYNWFFNQLRNAIGVCEQLFILSDCHPAIANAIANVYLECHHGICIYHMEKNLRKRYFLDVFLALFYNAATTYKRIEFYAFMDDIEKFNKVTVEYLKEESPERWACSFHTNRRYNMLTTNNVESMNAVLRKARQLPILGLIDYIQNKL